MKQVTSLLSILAILLSNIYYAQNYSQLGSSINGESGMDESGFVSLSSDGSTVAIGASKNDGSGADAGHVRVYTWDGSAWTQKGADIDGEAAGDHSGFFVSLSSDGSIVAIGAYGNDGSAIQSGHVRIYTWDGSAWMQQGADIDGESAQNFFGASVSLSSDGSTVAIGAFLNDGSGIDAGHVRIYTWDGSAWMQQGADIDGEAAGDKSGFRISLSSDGSTVAIGAPGNDGSGIDAGHIRIYTWDGSAWMQQGADIDGEAAGDAAGGSVSLSSDGSTVAIGAFLNDGSGIDAGHVRLYTWDGSAWIQQGADIDGEADGDGAYQVSLSSDGSTVAIGAFRNADSGAEAGHVRIYTWDGSAWIQQGADIDGEAAGDNSGVVSLSSDGSTVAIGAFKNDGSGIDAGHVRVFKRDIVSVKENSSLKVTIFPNPIQKEVTISSTEIIDIELTDINGKMLLSQTQVSGDIKLDLNTFSKGLYFVNIGNQNKTVTHKIIKE